MKRDFDSWLKTFANEIRDILAVTFIWFTDDGGWKNEVLLGMYSKFKQYEF